MIHCSFKMMDWQLISFLPIAPSSDTSIRQLFFLPTGWNCDLSWWSKLSQPLLLSVPINDQWSISKSLPRSHNLYCFLYKDLRTCLSWCIYMHFTSGSSSTWAKCSSTAAYTYWETKRFLLNTCRQNVKKKDEREKQWYECDMKLISKIWEHGKKKPKQSNHQTGCKQNLRLGKLTSKRNKSWTVKLQPELSVATIHRSLSNVFWVQLWCTVIVYAHNFPVSYSRNTMPAFTLLTQMHHLSSQDT